MPVIQATKLRETTPDAVVYRLPGDSARLRHQLTRGRKLPPYKAAQPVTHGMVKVVKDFDILDSKGNVLRTQPCSVEISCLIPAGIDLASFQPILVLAAQASLGQASDLFGGYLPSGDFTVTTP